MNKTEFEQFKAELDEHMDEAWREIIARNDSIAKEYSGGCERTRLNFEMGFLACMKRMKESLEERKH